MRNENHHCTACAATVVGPCMPPFIDFDIEFASHRNGHECRMQSVNPLHIDRNCESHVATGCDTRKTLDRSYSTFQSKVILICCAVDSYAARALIRSQLTAQQIVVDCVVSRAWNWMTMINDHWWRLLSHRFFAMFRRLRFQRCIESSACAKNLMHGYGKRTYSYVLIVAHLRFGRLSVHWFTHKHTSIDTSTTTKWWNCEKTKFSKEIRHFDKCNAELHLSLCVWARANGRQTKTVFLTKRTIEDSFIYFLFFFEFHFLLISSLFVRTISVLIRHSVDEIWLRARFVTWRKCPLCVSQFISPINKVAIGDQPNLSAVHTHTHTHSLNWRLRTMRRRQSDCDLNWKCIKYWIECNNSSAIKLHTVQIECLFHRKKVRK